MKISLISFTRNGANLSLLLTKFLNNQGYEAASYTTGDFGKEIVIEVIWETLKEWTKRHFIEGSGIVFIGATGIAVRTIADLIKNKTVDPAVLVIDEKGKFVIPLLSGHIGGANELTYEIADYLDAIPVITTATDLNQKFAVDLFAKKNNLFISRMDFAKGISAAILKDSKVGFYSDFPMIGTLPEGLIDKKNCEFGICISLTEDTKGYEKTLNLVPRIVTLGIGCRKGKSSDEIESVVLEILKKSDISINSIAKVTSIDLKKEEVGLLKFCDKLKLKLETYSAEELKEVQGIYLESDYVKSITGVGNVCERAAMLGSNNGILIQKKYASNGVTVSIAKQDWSVNFE